MSYSYIIGRDCEETAIGRPWKFSKFTRLVWADLAQEGRRLMPDPVVAMLEVCDAVAAKDSEIIRKLRAADSEEIVKAKAEKRDPILVAPLYEPIMKGFEDRAFVMKTRYLSAGSPDLNEFLMSTEGQSYLFFLLLRKYQPEITDEIAYDVYRDLGVNNGRDGRKTPNQIIDICNGTAPEPAKNEPLPA
jgi:hypothetical protein